jgi:hypothetical protein
MMEVLWEALKWIAWKEMEVLPFQSRQRSDVLLFLFLRFGPINGVGEQIILRFISCTNTLPCTSSSYFGRLSMIINIDNRPKYEEDGSIFGVLSSI